MIVANPKISSRTRRQKRNLYLPYVSKMEFGFLIIFLEVRSDDTEFQQEIKSQAFQIFRDCEPNTMV